jgi:predicted RNA binding protein YcfA (HicA-like mRNA interferase family)
MSVIPSLSYDLVIRALQRDGWIVVRQKGSHIRLQKRTTTETLKLTVPAHRPIKKKYPFIYPKASKINYQGIRQVIINKPTITCSGSPKNPAPGDLCVSAKTMRI